MFAGSRKPTFRTPATYVRPNLFTDRVTPLDGRRALFTLVITPRPVPRRWLASHKLSSASFRCFGNDAVPATEPPGSLNVFYFFFIFFNKTNDLRPFVLSSSRGSCSMELLKVIGYQVPPTSSLTQISRLLRGNRNMDGPHDWKIIKFIVRQTCQTS